MPHRKDRAYTGVMNPLLSVVLGYVKSNGECREAHPDCETDADDFPDPARHSCLILEDAMAVRKRNLDVVFPHAAGIDVGRAHGHR